MFTRSWRLRVQTSLRAKLIALAAILIAGMVGPLTYYFSSRHLETLEEEQRAHAGRYAQLLSGQVRSAVAFSDRQTAREILAGLEEDRDIVAVVLFGHEGEVLYSMGTPSTWVPNASRGVQAPKVFELGDRTSAVVPVLCLEGPEGTLVVELSTAKLTHRAREVMLTAVIFGSIALVLGVFAASILARRLAGRLRAIGDVATRVAEGSRELVMVSDHTGDEIGVLAGAFDQMLAELAKHQRELEDRVTERTAELLRTNEQLQAEMTRRAHVEVELRHAQKLESVGRLAAGIAHEINTPIQFVGDSVRFIGDAVNDLFGALRELEASAMEGTAPHDLSAQLLSKLEEIDFTYLAENMPGAVATTLEGMERVATIVRSMRVFAHASPEMVPADLNAAIQSTLTIARNEYKYVSDIETHLEDLPRVTCFAGEISQVLLNVLLNASHSIAEAAAQRGGGRGLITVRSRRHGQRVRIEITDTGTGIPTAIRDHVFDPFFTTKDVGKGTGQGLSIARVVVVEKHRGAIWFETKEGQGTTFFIELPIEPTAPALKVAA